VYILSQESKSVAFSLEEKKAYIWVTHIFIILNGYSAYPQKAGQIRFIESPLDCIIHVHDILLEDI